MLKDDTGIMELIKQAIKDAENKSLRERLKIVKNTFLTHRQIGESEAYYKLFKSVKLSDSTVQHCLFKQALGTREANF